MTTKQRKALEHAAELIATKKADVICDSLLGGIYINNIPEAMMINPGHEFLIWWGLGTMNKLHSSDTCRNARLLGIAFMLTMPKEMLQ